MFASDLRNLRPFVCNSPKICVQVLLSYDGQKWSDYHMEDLLGGLHEDNDCCDSSDLQVASLCW